MYATRDVPTSLVVLYGASVAPVHEASIDNERLVQMAVQAARAGKRDAARGIFRALSRDQAHDIRIWMGLAATASTADERREALERALAIEPHNELVKQELAALSGATALLVAPQRITQPLADDLQPQVAATLPSGENRPAVLVSLPSPDDEAVYFPAPASPGHERRAARRVPFGWFSGLLSIAALALVIWMAWPTLRPTTQARFEAQATPALLVPTNGVTVVPVATAAPAPPQATLVPATVVLPSALPATIVPVVPTIEPTRGPLALGTVLEYEGWNVTLLRPDYALVLDGAIGDVQPQGRFVLALIAVRNGSSTARSIPGDMFVLFDGQGRSYLPAPGVSSVYLNLFERGQRGDLALEDTFPANSGIVSVPLIFDVSPDAQGLLLTLAGDRDQGWLIADSASPGPPAAP